MSQMGSNVHFDRHLYTPGAGHISSEDCWCEPSRAYWITTADGHQLHVLEHNDTKFSDTVLPLDIAWVRNILGNL
jgi:hypothetical protein